MSKIKQIRMAKGINQRQLAQDAGVCQSLLSAVENGRMRLWPSMAEKLAGVLKVTVADLTITDQGGDSSKN
ncbi:MAG: helix-turn-helix transcriptional regulator [Dehalococcoidia bacterium]|jgi:transcriptional regulator with XRE-family HTH domain